MFELVRLVSTRRVIGKELTASALVPHCEQEFHAEKVPLGLVFNRGLRCCIALLFVCRF